MVNNLSDRPGLHQAFLSQLRNPEIQNDRALFRKNMHRLGQIMAYEISLKLPFREIQVQSPLGQAIHRIPAESPQLICILRAGLPFFNGFLDFFEDSDAGFIGAYRGRSDVDHQFEIELDYEAMPSTTNNTVLLIDPMLATGKSMVKAAQRIMEKGNPGKMVVASLISSPEGIAFVRTALPHAEIWTVSIDQGLNNHAYIVPGLGDAGDLSFGPKLD